MAANVSLAFQTPSGCTWTALSNQWVDLSNGIAPRLPAESQPEAFKLPPATATDFCTVDAGASVNCPSLSCVPHGNGTHTECVGHALPGRVTLADIPLPAPVLPAVLLTVNPVPLGACGDDYSPGQPDDLVLSSGALGASLAAQTTLSVEDLRGGAVVVRTLPNPVSKRTRHWGGSNAPYFTAAAMNFLVRDLGVLHLVCDLPSVDKEDDGGHLLAHRAFWGLPPRGAESQPGAPLSSRTITELAFVPDDAVDGPCLLSLQVAPIHLDAAPSRPLLFPICRR